jgi:CrcB protein
MTLLLVMLGGALGAVARYAVDLIVPALRIPVATLIVNVLGSAVLGALAGVGSALPGPVGALLGAGFCGALTTYSTFAYQTVDLARQRPRWVAALYVAATLALGLAAVWLGRSLV